MRRLGIQREWGEQKLTVLGLALALALYAGIGLWLTRGISFIGDETRFVAFSRGFDLETILTPHNGNLIAPARVIYAASLSLFGTSHLFIQVVELVGVMLASSLLFVFLRRRVGGALALGATLVILFLGSSADVVLSPVGLAQAYSTAAGLAAFLMIERGDRRGDAAACALLLLSVVTFSSGVAVLAGAGVWLLLDERRRSRLWVVAVPLLIYAAWFLWAQRFEQGTFSLSNASLIPSSIGDGLAATLRALTGLTYFGDSGAALGVSQALAVVALLGLGVVVATRRHRPPLWAMVAMPVAFWASIALVADYLRTPSAPRYLFFASVSVLLVAGEAARGIRLPGRARPVLLLLLLLALASNAVQLREAGARYRLVSAQARAVFGAYQLAGDNLQGTYPRFGFATAEEYLTGARRHEPYGFTPQELQRQPPSIRALADRALVESMAISPEPAPERQLGCARPVRSHGEPVPLPAGGVSLRSQTSGAIRLARFADAPTIEVGSLPGGGSGVSIRIPTDEWPLPWRASFETPGPVTVCPLR